MKKEVIKQGGVVPHLRFPEFKEEWVEKKLGDVLKYFKGYAFKSEIFVKEGIRVIRVSDLGRMSIRHDNEQIFVDVKEKEKYTNYQVSRKDIIITTVGSKPNLVESAVGRAIFIKDDLQALLNQNLLILRPINNKVTDPFFVYSQFSDKNYTNYIDIIQRGNANQSNITVKDLLEYKLFNTSLPEQTKIADFLTQVDTQISLLADKVAQLQLYKKGVMQKLFSQELRFKDEDGKDYPEWEEKKLGEVADITSSKRVFLSDYVEKGVPFYRGKEISELKKGNQPSDLLYITEESFSIFKEKYGVPQKDDLLITAVGTIGNTYHIPNNDPFYFKDGNLIWLRNIVNHNSIFIEYSLEYSKSEIEKISSGSTQKALTIVKLKVLKVSFPSLPEQTKIANFLTAIDEQIAGVEEQLAQSREFKKGLLQGMFV